MNIRRVEVPGQCFKVRCEAEGFGSSINLHARNNKVGIVSIVLVWFEFQIYETSEWLIRFAVSSLSCVLCFEHFVWKVKAETLK